MPVNSAGVVKVYSAFAPVYDATFGQVVGRYHRHIGKAAVGAQRLLEIGVGTGLTLRHYPAGADVTAVDLCPAMLARAEQQVARGVPARVKLQLADAERLPFDDGAFDMVVLPFVVSVTPEPGRLLDEARRVLAPGGQLLLLNHFAGVAGLRWLERLFAPFADRVGFRSDLTLERVLQLASLPVEEVRHLRPIGFFTLVRLRRPLAVAAQRSGTPAAPATEAAPTARTGRTPRSAQEKATGAPPSAADRTPKP
jgi:phosphatidylethanolamine/phosphatidyl-N-methylethanolamine N-methyltransferase